MTESIYQYQALSEQNIVAALRGRLAELEQNLFMVEQELAEMRAVKAATPMLSTEYMQAEEEVRQLELKAKYLRVRISTVVLPVTKEGADEDPQE